MNRVQPAPQSRRAEPPKHRTAAGAAGEIAVSQRSAPTLDDELPRQVVVRLDGSLNEPDTPDVERSPWSREPGIRREVPVHHMPIAPADAGASVPDRGGRAADEEFRAAGQWSVGRAELGRMPPISAAAPEVARKTLQGRPSAPPVEGSTEPAPQRPGVMRAGGMITASSLKRGSQSLDRKSESSTVHVTIGTLEVRANTLPAQPAAKPPTVKGPRLGLDEYLRQRRDGGRR